MEFTHKPVLLQECIEALRIKSEGVYVDGTLGRAGHSREIAKRLTTGRLICIDRDQAAIDAARERLAPWLERVTLAAPVLERLPEPEAARCRKMFGEYMVYLNDRPVLLVCDNTVFVKRLPELADLMKSAPTGVPYSGSKEHYILDMDDTERATAVLAVLERVTPLPKPRKKKG